MEEDQGSIQFDRKKYKALKERYEEAKKKDEERFTFEGKELVTDYAKYLLQYLSEIYGLEDK